MKAKILVVDDEPIWQEILRDLLWQKNYQVHTVNNYLEAIEAISSGQFHLIIVDLRLQASEKSSPAGLQLLEFINKRATKLPYCIVLTGYPSVEFARASFADYGVIDFFAKLDFQEQLFLEAVQKAIANAAQAEPTLALSYYWENLFHSPDNMDTVTTHSQSMDDLISLISTHLNLPYSKHPIKQSPQWLIGQLEIGILFAEARNITLIPIVALRDHAINQTTLEKLLISAQQSLPQPIHVFLLLVDDEQQKQTIIPISKKLKKIFSYDIILLNFQDVEGIFKAAKPIQSVRELFLAEVNLETISPFVTTGPVTGRRFFGREHHLREITEQISSQNYILIGGRLIGKTSIIKQLEQLVLPANGFHTLYHDCSFTLNERDLLIALANNKSWFPLLPDKAFDSFFKLAQNLLYNKPLVILFDEFDGLIKSDRQAGYTFTNSLRAMAHTGACHFIFCGEATLKNEVMDANSPLFNFANIMTIGRLDFHAVEELITRPMHQLAITLLPELEIVQTIWEFTSGHPNIIQRLCQRLIRLLNQRQNRQITLADVQALISAPDFLRKDFLNVYWGRATVLERLCSLIMASDTQVQTLPAIYQVMATYHLKITLNQVDEALERLVDLRNILHRTNKGYEFAVTAFPQIITKTARLNDLIALDCETYEQYGDVEPGRRWHIK